jgi:hypothetical protein
MYNSKSVDLPHLRTPVTTFIISSSRHVASWFRYALRSMSLFIASLLLSERNAQHHSKYLQNMQVFTEMKKYLPSCTKKLWHCEHGLAYSTDSEGRMDGKRSRARAAHH